MEQINAQTACLNTLIYIYVCTEKISCLSPRVSLYLDIDWPQWYSGGFCCFYCCGGLNTFFSCSVIGRGNAHQPRCLLILWVCVCVYVWEGEWEYLYAVTHERTHYTPQHRNQSMYKVCVCVVYVWCHHYEPAVCICMRVCVCTPVLAAVVL